jgi:hypothetical protein
MKKRNKRIFMLIGSITIISSIFIGIIIYLEKNKGGDLNSTDSPSDSYFELESETSSDSNLTDSPSDSYVEVDSESIESPPYDYPSNSILVPSPQIPSHPVSSYPSPLTLPPDDLIIIRK